MTWAPHGLTSDQRQGMEYHSAAFITSDLLYGSNWMHGGHALIGSMFLLICLDRLPGGARKDLVSLTYTTRVMQLL